MATKPFLRQAQSFAPCPIVREAILSALPAQPIAFCLSAHGLRYLLSFLHCLPQPKCYMEECSQCGEIGCWVGPIKEHE